VFGGGVGLGIVFDGAVGVMFDGVVGAMSNGLMGVYIHPGVYDSFVGVASRSPSFDIFIKVPYFSFNVYVAFGDRKKMANQVLGVGVVYVD
jgi:hypothetical protein